MFKQKKTICILFFLIFFLAACVPRSTNTTYDIEDIPDVKVSSSKKIVIYYANWTTHVDNKFNQPLSHAIYNLPWDKFTHINHAFWTINEDFNIESISPWDDTQWNQGYVVLTSNQSINTIISNSNNKTYIAKPIEANENTNNTQTVTYEGIPYISTGEELDLSTVKYSGQFAMYKAMKEKYPKVCVILSVGGWTRGENFSQMASTAENRSTFIQSVINVFKEYEWLGGIDLDWEYPSIDREHDANNPSDYGCPGDPENDSANFTALLTELRASLDSNGLNDKIITICERIDGDNVSAEQDLSSISKIVDFINIMTYDVYGAWSKETGPLSPLKTASTKNYPSVETSVLSYLKYFIPEQINIGTPFYSRGWDEVELDPDTNSPLWQLSGPKNNSSPTTFYGKLDLRPGIYGKYKNKSDTTGKLKLERWPSLKGKKYGQTGGGLEPWWYCKKLESSNSWTAGYDEASGSAWLYNSKLKRLYTYESEQSLQDKIDYVKSQELGGMIIWDISGDSTELNFPMTTILSNEFLNH